MPADTVDDVANAVKATVKRGRKKADAAAGAAQRKFAQSSKSAEKVLMDGVETLRTRAKPHVETARKTIDDAQKALLEEVEALRARTKPHVETARAQIDEAQAYVTERVKERPLAALLGGLSAGLVLGFLLSNRDK